jgi:hypothetical protein
MAKDASSDDALTLGQGTVLRMHVPTGPPPVVALALFAPPLRGPSAEELVPGRAQRRNVRRPAADMKRPRGFGCRG